MFNKKESINLNELNEIMNKKRKEVVEKAFEHFKEKDTPEFVLEMTKMKDMSLLLLFQQEILMEIEDKRK